MAPKDDTTALIMTLNEENNLERTLSKLGWTRRVLVVDSGSTDGTIDIAERSGHARVVHRPFDDFASQYNFGLSLIQSEWVLSIDADYELTDELVAEIMELDPGTAAGFSARFVYCIFGYPLKGSVYPSRTVLYRRRLACYRNEGHTQRVTVAGRIEQLHGRIRHDDRKPLQRWLASQQRYAKVEADHLLSAARSELGRVDRIRLLAWPAPILVFFYALIFKRCLFDGWPGWLYVLQRTLAEIMLAIELVDRRLRAKAPEGES